MVIIIIGFITIDICKTFFLWKGKATHVADGEGNMSCSKGVRDIELELSCGMAAFS